MECLGPQCASMLLEWLNQRGGAAGPVAGQDSGKGDARADAPKSTKQGLLWGSAPYQEDAAAVRTPAELAGAMEHLEYAVFRRYQNQLTKAERARLDNTIDNALFKADRYAERLEPAERARVIDDIESVRKAVREGRERVERMRHQAKRADLKLAQLATLTPEGFEEFVAELFEAMGYQVDHVGGTGDEGADLMARRKGMVAVVQCKYFTRGWSAPPSFRSSSARSTTHGATRGFS